MKYRVKTIKAAKKAIQLPVKVADKAYKAKCSKPITLGLIAVNMFTPFLDDATKLTRNAAAYVYDKSIEMAPGICSQLPNAWSNVSLAMAASNGTSGPSNTTAPLFSGPNVVVNSSQGGPAFSHANESTIDYNSRQLPS